MLHNNGELALVGQLTEPRFMISLLLLNKVLGLTKGISESLQAKELDLTVAISEIDTVVETMTSWRTDQLDTQYATAFKAASNLYAKTEDCPGIDFPQPRLAGCQRNRNNVPADSAYDYYKRLNGTS